ncbi:ATP-binding protein [Marinobacterium sediminicola]|uniref:CHASE domain-containing protein n=1 Tax=Marinobacterium sediminicola TaxID=518898 RepID=A0ABY1S1V4_9GAMM|nr:ATP-binding protein [Marinobacterium sediminicola]ULG69353.1 ATP-binding protein [Marinobacterium sediminicola]SMR75500.1 CHASE domain-containing protein [Marinobacterium sediminicola]
MPSSPTLIAGAFWLLINLCTFTLVIRQDLVALERHQQTLLSTLADQVIERMQQSRELLLQTARLTDVEQDVLFSQSLRHELESIHRLAPAVKRIQVQQLVRNDAVDAFEQSMRQRYPDFLLHGLSAMTPPATERTGTPVFHPLVAVIPDTPEVQPPLLGTDLGLIPELKEALQATRSSHDISYSRVYNQGRGQPLLNLFLMPPTERQHILSVVVSLPRLLDSRTLPPGSRITMTQDNLEHEVLLVTTAGNRPLFMHPMSQPFPQDRLPVKLTLEYPVYWHDFSLWTLLLMLSLGSLGCWLLHAWLRQRQATNSCYLESAEVHSLQEHLRQHSEQLQQQLQENQRLTHKILDIQERERRHLAQELHDELGQCLTAIRTDARMLLQEYPDSRDTVNQHAESIDAIAGHIYDVTYDLMHALRPTLLDDLGLVDAVRELIRGQHLERQGIGMELRLKGALNDMEERYNINLYRMIQEALTNLQRHARCTKASIRLQRLDADSDSDRLELDIRDNGCGFDPERIGQKGRFGVLGMQTRAKALGGSLQLCSEPGQGTRLLIRIPLAPALDTDVAIRSVAESAAPQPLDASHPPASVGV